MSWSVRSCMFALSLSLMIAVPLLAQKASCTFKTFVLNPSDLNSPRENAFGVNDNRTVVGFGSYPFNKPNIKAFVHYADGTIKYWRPSGAPISTFSARNDAGNTVGNYVDSSKILHAVFLHGSTVTQIVHRNAANHSTSVVGINKYNTILGSYTDAAGNSHMFKRFSNGSFASVPNFPGATTTTPSAINDNGAIVGTYSIAIEGPDISHGFIYHNGNWAKLNYRGKTTNTEVTGISDSGVIVGDHFGSGFLYKNGVFEDIVGPNGAGVVARGISAGGIITGDMWISGSGSHGFAAVCQ